MSLSVTYVLSHVYVYKKCLLSALRVSCTIFTLSCLAALVKKSVIIHRFFLSVFRSVILVNKKVLHSFRWKKMSLFSLSSSFSSSSFAVECGIWCCSVVHEASSHRVEVSHRVRVSLVPFHRFGQMSGFRVSFLVHVSALETVYSVAYSDDEQEHHDPCNPMSYGMWVCQHVSGRRQVLPSREGVLR